MDLFPRHPHNATLVCIDYGSRNKQNNNGMHDFLHMECERRHLYTILISDCHCHHSVRMMVRKQ